jgi:hypothetical protein
MNMDLQGKFYIGHKVDPTSGKSSGEKQLYDPSDMTTHGVVVGMTGSGKTGLCIIMLEEAALNGIPALMIDPKGDITNALLHFPELRPEDFLPWVNPDEARREGKSLEQAASETAARWRSGLASHGIGPERLQQLKGAVDYTIFTPGSDAGRPISILASLKAPTIPWESNREILREKISATATALLSLVGMRDIDPVRSREHILLANIFEHAWSQGRDLDLGELILQTQSPPFKKLGVFDVNTFFPEKERFALSISLNSILAAPSFQTWVEGEPLDIQTLLFSKGGKPRHSIFYLAHLGDTERMFFVTLLLSALETWMRGQTGSTSLRSILYFDEIFGYLPPVANPPSKTTMLRLLKQARAFGVGLLLATQNPVDVDYKALSNAGSWFIGKLQTDQDKQRLLDGLQSAAEAGLNRAAYDRLISSLGKRVFLLHNVHRPEPVLFQTRWAMNYLAGPLTRAQIPALNQLAEGQPGAIYATSLPLDEFQAVPVSRAAGPAEKPLKEELSLPGSATRPPLPAAIREYFLPHNLTLNQSFRAAGRVYPKNAAPLTLLYRPMLLAQISIRFLNRRYNLDYQNRLSAQIPDPDRRGVIRWENHLSTPLEPAQMDPAPDPHSRFMPIEAPLSDARLMTSIQKDFLDWAAHYSQAKVWANEALKLYAGPETSRPEFEQLSSSASRQAAETEKAKSAAAFEKKLETLRGRLAKEERELDEDETRHSQRKMEEMGTHAENIFGLFGGRKSSRRISTSLSKRRMTEQAKAAVQESRQAIADFKRQIAALEKERDEALAEIERRWEATSGQISEISIAPLKKDILLELYGVAWMPFYLVQTAGALEEVPAYGRA